jgi:hypothetical protein
MTAHDGTVLRRTEKKCSECNELKSLDNFSRDKSRKDGVDAYCKPCRYLKNRKWAGENKEVHRKSTLNTRRKLEYGVSPEQFDLLLKNQENLCAICKIAIDHTSHLDHCHNTGKVRGVLCPNCNKGLGLFSDDIHKLYSAIKYLDSH